MTKHICVICGYSLNDGQDAEEFKDGNGYHLECRDQGEVEEESA